MSPAPFLQTVSSRRGKGNLRNRARRAESRHRGHQARRQTPRRAHGSARNRLNYLNTHGKDLHGEPLGKYFTHASAITSGSTCTIRRTPFPLKPGMVITIEPGIYIPEENIGVRIEDTLVVTEDGSRNLSGALPREVSQIEKLVGK